MYTLHHNGVITHSRLTGVAYRDMSFPVPKDTIIITTTGDVPTDAGGGISYSDWITFKRISTHSSEMVIEKLSAQKKSTTKKEDPSNILFDFMQKYIDEHEGIRARTSLSVYKSVKKHLQDYSKANGKKVTFDSIDFNFFQSFQNYLYKDKTDSNGKVIKIK